METTIIGITTFLTVCIIILNRNKELTVNQYISNTYLYILLGIMIIGLVWKYIDNNQSIASNMLLNGWYLFGLIIITFISLYIVISTPNDKTIIKHIAWTICAICFGMTTYFTYKMNRSSGQLTSIFISLIFIIGLLSYLAYSMPLNTFDNWLKPMVIILFGLIVIQLIDLLLISTNSFSFNHKDFFVRTRIYSWIGLLLFSGFLLYDTQTLIKRAKQITQECISKNQSLCADYPRESLNIFLDIINLFNSQSNLSL
jgi:FtsH-binding integral membrane protein